MSANRLNAAKPSGCLGVEDSACGWLVHPVGFSFFLVNLKNMIICMEWLTIGVSVGDQVFWGDFMKAFFGVHMQSWYRIHGILMDRILV